jgi:uncharacterized protein (DUF2252 family)
MQAVITSEQEEEVIAHEELSGIFKAKLTSQERKSLGKKARENCSRKSHAEWNPSINRPDPISIVEQADRGRMPELLALRHGRMAQSAFTFYRGSALAMAADLSTTPNSGIRTHCCGDAHLCNFGGYATPERRIIFSINDLDETCPAPWEWDVKRLAASFVVGSRDNNFSESSAKDVALTCVRAYRERMAEFSEMKALELWYYALYADMLVSEIKDPSKRQQVINRLNKEKGKTVADDIFPNLVDSVNGSHFIKDQYPTIFHPKGYAPGQVLDSVKKSLIAYRSSLVPAYQKLFDRYELLDAAIKVVGVGSVGTYCWVLLLSASENDPFFLQVKQANASVLEAYAGKSEFANHGQRIVNGYRLMQPFSDIFLGWTEGELEGRQFFVRQLRDMKISARVNTFNEELMTTYAEWCGWALALSHARSGDPLVISGYMGSGDVLDKAIANFAVSYADQNEKDYAKFRIAIRDGKISAEMDVN